MKEETIGGQDPTAGGVISLLGELQSQAAELLSEIEGEQKDPPKMTAEQTQSLRTFSSGSSASGE